MRGLVALGTAVVAIVLQVGPIHAQASGDQRAGDQVIGEQVFGAATAEITEPGSLTPTGQGRFVIEDRMYSGRSVGRSIDDRVAACFSGRLTSTEEWALAATRMVGEHDTTIQIRPTRGTVTLRLRGQMDALSASGSWEVVRATGQCDGLEAEGQYTATYSDRTPQLRLTFDGRGRVSR